MRIAPLEKVIKTGQILVPLFLRSDPCKVPEITISCKVPRNPNKSSFQPIFTDISGLSKGTLYNTPVHYESCGV